MFYFATESGDHVLVSGARNFATGVKNRRQKPMPVFWRRFLEHVSWALVLSLTPAYLPNYIPACLPTYVPAYLPTSVLTFFFQVSLVSWFPSAFFFIFSRRKRGDKWHMLVVG